MGTYTLNSVGTYYSKWYPDTSFYNYSEIRSGWEADTKCNGTFANIGFLPPEDINLKYKSVTNILIRPLSKCIYRDYQNGSSITTPIDKRTSEYFPRGNFLTSYAAYHTKTYNTKNDFPYTERQDISNVQYFEYISDEEIIEFIVNSFGNNLELWLSEQDGYYYSDSYQTRYYYLYEIAPDCLSLIIDYDNVNPIVTPAYPVNVNVKQTNALTFTWQYTEDQLPTSGSTVGQKSYTLIITNTDTGTSTTYSETSSNQFKEFAANTFDVGSYTYTIQVTSNDDIQSAVASGVFYVIGPTEAPTIDSVSNNSIPTISWTSSQQDAVEIRISQNGTLLWESGLLAGSDRTSYQLPIMLDNGQYTAELRVLNTFGYYTEYDSYPFELTPEGPSVATNVRITTTNKYGVNIKADVPTDTTAYVVRRERGGTAEIISKFTGDYTDYYVAGNKAYEYAVRTYETGFTDSDYVSIFVPLDGVVIRDCRDSDNFINIYRSDSEFDVRKSDAISATLIQCLGRQYPIKEMGEWITSVRTVSGHVSEEDYMKLTELALNAEKVYFQSNGEFIVCNLEIEYEGKYFAGNGVFVTLTLTRIEDELEVEL